MLYLKKHLHKWPRRLGSNPGFLNSSEIHAGRWPRDESRTPLSLFSSYLHLSLTLNEASCGVGTPAHMFTLIHQLSPKQPWPFLG